MIDQREINRGHFQKRRGDCPLKRIDQKNPQRESERAKEREKEREKCILKMRELFRGKFILRLVKKETKKGKKYIHSFSSYFTLFSLENGAHSMNE